MTVYDTEGLIGTDPVADVDDAIRDLHKALQERFNDGVDGADEGDMYFPLTGTEVSDTEAGEKRKITLRERASDPGGAAGDNNANKGFLYTKEADSKTEFFLRSEKLAASQITHGGGKLFPTPHEAEGNTDRDMTVSDTWTDLAGMSLTFTTIGGDVLVTFNATFQTEPQSGNLGRLRIRILLDDVQIHQAALTIIPSSSYYYSDHISLQKLCTSLSAAEHVWKVQYYRADGNWKQPGTSYPRILNAIEYRP